MRRTARLSLAAALLVAAPALAQDRPADPAAGREVAERWCTACHVVDRAGTGTDAAPPFPTVARTRTPDWIRGFLAHPHTGLMPPFDLTLDEIDALVAHIATLDDGGEPTPAAPAVRPGRAALDLPGDPAAGRDLAEVVCSACHAIPGMEPFVDAPGALPFQALADDPAVTGMALHAFLVGPHPTMPNIVLSPGQLDNIIAYILSLRGG